MHNHQTHETWHKSLVKAAEGSEAHLTTIDQNFPEASIMNSPPSSVQRLIFKHRIKVFKNELKVLDKITLFQCINLK